MFSKKPKAAVKVKTEKKAVKAPKKVVAAPKPSVSVEPAPTPAPAPVPAQEPAPAPAPKKAKAEKKSDGTLLLSSLATLHPKELIKVMESVDAPEIVLVGDLFDLSFKKSASARIIAALPLAGKTQFIARTKYGAKLRVYSSLPKNLKITTT